MEHFLESVERQAYRIAILRTGHREDALDAVQETMMRFVEKYSDKPRSDWKPLFYRILYNQIVNFHRKRILKNKWFFWTWTEEDREDLVESYPDLSKGPVDREVEVKDAWLVLQKALKELSLRQQQAFLLRGWEEMSVAETSTVMQCSESSVKTHYHRALETLRERLGDHWP